MKENICINKEDIVIMSRLIEELQSRLEALELASDSEFMKSLKKSKEEIKKRDFADWDAL